MLSSKCRLFYSNRIVFHNFLSVSVCHDPNLVVHVGGGWSSNPHCSNLAAHPTIHPGCRCSWKSLLSGLPSVFQQFPQSQVVATFDDFDAPKVGWLSEVDRSLTWHVDSPAGGTLWWHRFAVGLGQGLDGRATLQHLRYCNMHLPYLHFYFRML